MTKEGHRKNKLQKILNDFFDAVHKGNTAKVVLLLRQNKVQTTCKYALIGDKSTHPETDIIPTVRIYIYFISS